MNNRRRSRAIFCPELPPQKFQNLTLKLRKITVRKGIFCLYLGGIRRVVIEKQVLPPDWMQFTHTFKQQGKWVLYNFLMSETFLKIFKVSYQIAHIN